MTRFLTDRITAPHPVASTTKGDCVHPPDALASEHSGGLAGVHTFAVDYQQLSKEITAVGYVEFNERAVKNVSARVKGRIDTLNVNETGQMVDAGDVLASLYSPDLNVTMQNLLDAQK